MIYISTLIEKNYTKRLSFINTNQLDIIEEKGDYCEFKFNGLQIRRTKEKGYTRI
ncbi:hypothetical protein Q5M85_02725 [Paraclostridium bifermentans]|nr:hypothetical protein [Paraclostridium bifermentans]